MFDNTNLYTFRTEDIGGILHYYVSFIDGQAVLQETEVSKALYMEMSDSFVKKERNLRRSDERHKEQSELTEQSLQKRAAIHPVSLEDTVDQQDDAKRLWAAVADLPEVQRRRFLLHYIDGLTLEKIAEIEGRHFTSINESISAAAKKIKNYL